MERYFRPVAAIVSATVLGVLAVAVGAGLLVVPSALKWNYSRRAASVAQVVRKPVVAPPPGARRHPRENLAPLATVTVSSTVHAGPPNIIDAAGVADGTPDGREWVAQGEAGGAWVKLEWEYPVSVVEVTLYDRTSKEDNILGGTLIFDDQSAISVPALPASGTAWSTRFPAKVIRSLTFRIDASEGAHAGLAEIMVFGSAVQ